MSRTLNLAASLSPPMRTALQKLVDDLDTTAVNAQTAADAARDSWFDTAAAGLRTNAAACWTLANTIAAKVQRLQYDAEGMKLLQDAKDGRWVETLPNLDQLAYSLTLAGGISTVAKDTARDAGTALVTTGKGFLALLEYLPWIIGVAAIAWLATRVQK